MSSRFRSIPLGEVKTKTAAVGVEFLSADVPKEPSPFAIVRYALHGERQRLGLRLDMDKQVFLDHLEDERVDSVVRDSVSTLVDAIVDAKASEQETIFKIAINSE